MTTTTIEYEEVVTQEEEVDVCDDCGREVDDYGVEYSPSGFQRINDGKALASDLHFCSECLEQKLDGDVSPHVERAKDWADKKASGGYTAAENAEMAAEILGIGKVMVLCTVGGVLVATFMGMPIGLQVVVGLWAIASAIIIPLASLFASDTAEIASGASK